jgi:hypothetical protein
MSRPKTVRQIVGIGGARAGAAVLVVLGVVLSTEQRTSAAEIQIFTATLSGAQEVPAVASAGTGTGTVMLNAAENQITVNLTFSGLTSNATMSHIHGAAAPGANAGVLFDFAAVTPAATSGTIPQQTFAITPAQVAELKAGLYYFNVHTGNFGGGEIRGQIGLAATQFNTTLTGAQQVPAVSSPGTGTGSVALNAAEDLLIVHMSFSGLTSNANMAHIHGPAAAGANAGVLFDFAGVTPAATSGSIPQQTFAITPAQVADLKAGLYYFNIHTTNFGGGEIRGQIAAGPTVALDRTALQFAAASSGVAFTSQTSSQVVRLTQTGAGSVTWTATPSAPWLVVSPTSGSGSATLTVSTQFVSGLSSSQTGNVNLAFSGAGNTAGPIAVTLTVSPTGTTSPPTGAFDTPADGLTGVTGSIAVTGWAMDDVEVTRVRILRDPVAGEPAGTLIPIGDAVLVDGARPDVQLLFPNSPRNTRAGWGYLMLTNFLPSLGNGTFRLHAIADDADGNSTPLGTKTIVCDNASATTPFGAIDTPIQGGTVSGNVTNFGWVLSRNPRRADPPGGGTVRVVVDGVFLPQVPSGWNTRTDLAALFPAADYPGIGTALGVAAFDSTSLANGVHTLSWVVTDNLGAASGIGSRYFTVSNGALFLDPDSFRLTASAEATAVKKAEATGNQKGGSLIGRRGFDPDTSYRTYKADADGRITIQAEELDRIEVLLDGIGGERRIEGALRVGSTLAPLPIGSRIDPTTRTFTWHPGVGFVGAYDLVLAGRDVRIVLNPKGSTRVGPQTVIDLPGATAVGRAFVLAGWAADLDSSVDRGVDAVHVWAYPVNASERHAGDPIWIGAAAYGGARPDVAAVYGERFRDTGYGIIVRGLAPGTYDLAVFAYSTVVRGFVPAKTVRVTVR